MNIYIMSGDSDFLANEFEDLDKFWNFMDFRHRGVELPDSFKPKLRFYCDMIGGSVIPTDFPASCFLGTQVLSRRALEVLWPMLEKVGRLYDIQPSAPKAYMRTMDYKLFVMWRELEVVDSEQMAYLTDTQAMPKSEVSRYAFDPAAIAGLDIFTAKGTEGDIFVTDRFLDLVEKHRLSGIRLLPVWSDTEGPLRTFERSGIPYKRIPPGCGPNVVSKRRAMREWLAGTRERQPGWRGAE